MNEDIHQFVTKLRNKTGKNIWIVGGGELFDSFLQNNLVDEIILTIAPIILGNGIPLFKKGNHPYALSLKGTKTYNQFVTLHYDVQRNK